MPFGDQRSYWGATDEILADEGAPTCPNCGNPMFPEDDHGRFTCFCTLGRSSFDARTRQVIPIPQIPQADTTGMTDEKKAKIPPINRLFDTPTVAESALLSQFLNRGPEAIGSKRYGDAREAVEKERTG